VKLYREAAGQIGDPTVPAALKKAALQTVRQIQQKYVERASGEAPALAPRVLLMQFHWAALAALTPIHARGRQFLRRLLHSLPRRAHSKVALPPDPTGKS